MPPESTAPGMGEPITGEQDRYLARVRAALEDFDRKLMTVEQLRAFLRKISA